MAGPDYSDYTYRLAAKIVKTKGRGGQLIVQAAFSDDWPLSLRAGQEVWIVPPLLRGPRHSRLGTVRSRTDRQGLVVEIVGVDELTVATQLTGRYLLVISQADEVLSDGTPTVCSAASADSTSTAPDVAPANSTPIAFEAVSALSAPTVSGAPPVPGAPAASGSGGEISTFCDTALGELGQLRHIRPGPVYDYWVIDGPYGTLEVPAVAAYIIKTEPGLITVNLPAGFVEQSG
ncbi:MAG: hypothetical protein LBC35_02840 [Coriobacteriales bacterium]|jgi:ribosomal 30S subunit maturation factor RimM|nr:hypothetical protein [Coriobacteriales bacterium]